MPHHLAFEARVRGPAIGPTVPAVRWPHFIFVVPAVRHSLAFPISAVHHCCCSSFTTVCHPCPWHWCCCCWCCTPPRHRPHHSSSLPFIICCVTCIWVSLSSRNGACCDPVSRHSQWQQSRQGTEGVGGCFFKRWVGDVVINK
jgi:hypothetical protein